MSEPIDSRAVQQSRNQEDYAFILNSDDAIFMTSIPRIQAMVPRNRAAAAVRWCRIKWPLVEPEIHKAEADAIFRGDPNL